MAMDEGDVVMMATMTVLMLMAMVGGEVTEVMMAVAVQG